MAQNPNPNTNPNYNTDPYNGQYTGYPSQTQYPQPQQYPNYSQQIPQSSAYPADDYSQYNTAQPAQTQYNPYNNPYNQPYQGTQPMMPETQSYNQQPLQSQYNASDYSQNFQPMDYNQNVQPSPQQFSQMNQPTQLQTDYTQTPYGNYPAESTTPKNTFQDKKTGSSVFTIIGMILILGLLIACGVLFWINYGQNQVKSTSVSSPNSSSVSSSLSSSSSSTSSSSSSSNNFSTLTGGANSPATLAKKFSVTITPLDWVLRKFTSPDRDTTGKCVNINVCGDDADPDTDGFTNLDEYNYQTDPLISDTDKDGISDGNEVYIYFTDPNKTDSDNDSTKDGVEVVACLDPINLGSSVMLATRISQITGSAGIKPLKEPTISTFKTAGATTIDIQKGYIESKCQINSTTTDTASKI